MMNSKRSGRNYKRMLITVVSANTTIYLDHAATTPTDPEIVSLMAPYFGSAYGNPSSMHTAGRRAEMVIQKTRQQIAQVLGAQPSELIFTGSGTEADNLAIMGIARAYRRYGRRLIISAIEHKAVSAAADILRAEGFEIVRLPVDATGLIDVNACMRLVTPDTILVSVMYANNEIGTIEPIQSLAQALQAYRQHQAAVIPLLHTDACQAAGVLPIQVRELGVDLMTLNSSKIYGPKGVGLLYKKETVLIDPVIVGGDQEYGLRAGTESLPLIVGFGAALEKAEACRLEEAPRLQALRDYFITELLSRIPGAILNGHPTLRLPGNIHISIPAVEGESLLLLLDAQGVAVSTGSACSAKDLRPSHVLLAIGQDANLIHGSLRLSLGRETTREDLDRVLTLLPPIVAELTKISALTSYAYVQ